MENYRPKYIEFSVAHDGTLMPENFGEFQNHEEAMKFLGGNFVCTNQQIVVNRIMDHVEKKLLREQYEHTLENILPANEQKLSDAQTAFTEAKRKLQEAQEVVNATMTEVRLLAKEVKRGLVDMQLDDMFTVKIPYRGRFYWYTYIDKEIRLVKITEIPGHEKTEIFAASASNEDFIDNHFFTKIRENGETEPQEGPQE